MTKTGLVIPVPPFVIPAKAGIQSNKESPAATHYSTGCRVKPGMTRKEWATPYHADGCQPASAHSSPETMELEIMKQIASAISSGRISLLIWVSGRMWLSI